MYLPLWIITGKVCCPPPKWIAGEVIGGGACRRGVPVGGLCVGCSC